MSTDSKILDEELLDIENTEGESQEQEIEQNQLRERAKKLMPITKKRWEKVDKEDNQYIMEEYFASMSNLSPSTVVQYRSAIRIFLVWNAEHNRNKKLHSITKRDFMKYITFLTNHGLSSSGIKLKKSAVSSMCNFIELVLADEIDDYKMFRNFAENLPNDVNTNVVYEKKLITKEEYQKMMDELIERGHTMGQCWLALAFTTGARRGELLQFKNDILTAPYEVDEDGNELNFKLTDYVRGKGSGRDGKQIRFMIPKDTMTYVEALVKENKKKGKSKYLFVTKYKGRVSQISTSWANDFCRRILSPIVGRRINPHLFKASAITHKLNDGHSISVVSEFLGHHSSIEVTQNHYNLQDNTAERNSLF